jgi:hypothetical protein
MVAPMFHGIVSVPTTTPSWTIQFLVTASVFEALGVDTQLSAVLTDRTGRPVADDVLAELSPEQRARLLAAGPDYRR